MKLDAVKTFFLRVWRWVRSLFPAKGDSTFEIVRKCLFFVAAVALVVSLSMLIYESVVIPTSYSSEMDTVREIYRPSTDTPGGVSNDKEQDPMQLAALREINSDTVGWLTFQSTNEKVGLNIDYPVMQGKDNDYYLNRTFYKKQNKTGSLFLDYRNTLTPVQDQALIIFGHNLSTGLMFSGLNKLVNNLYNARTATSFTFTTDAGTDTYLVFGIMITNADKEQGPVFNYLRRSFSSAEDFNQYVEDLRRRSMYDYPVDVNENDQLMLLSTCVPRRQTKYKGSRTVVIARKLREGESPALNGSITTNKDCLYPLVYYVSQNLPIPNDYTSNTTNVPSAATTTGGYYPTVSVGIGDSTGTAVSDSTTTTVSQGTSSSQTVGSGNTSASIPSVSGSSASIPSVSVPTVSGSTAATVPSGNASGSATKPGATTVPGSKVTATAPSSVAPSTAAPSAGTTKPTETTKATQPTETTKVTEATEPTESTEATESTAEATEPTESTEATEPTESTETTKATEPTEPTEETQPSADESEGE